MHLGGKDAHVSFPLFFDKRLEDGTALPATPVHATSPVASQTTPAVPSQSKPLLAVQGEPRLPFQANPNLCLLSRASRACRATPTHAVPVLSVPRQGARACPPYPVFPCRVSARRSLPLLMTPVPDTGVNHSSKWFETSFMFQ